MADKVEEFIKNHPAATGAMLGMVNVLLSKPGMSEDEVRHNLLLAASSGKVVTGAKNLAR